MKIIFQKEIIKRNRDLADFNKNGRNGMYWCKIFKNIQQGKLPGLSQCWRMIMEQDNK